MDRRMDIKSDSECKSCDVVIVAYLFGCDIKTMASPKPSWAIEKGKS